MKIRNTIKGLALVGATAALLPVGSAMAAGPNFNGMSVDGTANISGCPTTANTSCSVLLQEAGFLQQEVTVGTGASAVVYIQTVVIDTNDFSAGALTDQAFADNTFIQMGGGSGIKGQQVLNDESADYSSSGNDFDSTTTLLIGWADDGTENLQVVQTLWDNNSTGTVGSPGVVASDVSQTEDDFYNTFTLGINLDSTGAQSGKRMDMTQDVGLSDPTVSAPGSDFQRFIIRQRSGDLLTAGGSHGLDQGSGGAGSGGSVAWAAADDVMVAWLGQTIALGGVGTSDFGFMSVDNLSETTAPISTFSTSTFDSTASPFNWGGDIQTVFGAPPVLP